MRSHRFYIAETIGDKIELEIHSLELIHQVRDVFRLKKGDSIIIFDGSGMDFTCRIEELGKNHLKLSVMESNKSRFMPTRDIYLCASVVKKDNFEFIVEKATELGVTHIIPVMAERSEKKGLNEERLKKIAVEASEQSGRGNIPTIFPIMGLEECMNFCIGRTSAKLIAFHTEGEPFSGRLNLPDSSPIAIFIGPEGGWSPEEIKLFHKNNIPIVCLGKQVLRAETAVIAALSLVMLGNEGFR